MSKVFAVAREVPSDCTYLTAGRLYETAPDVSGFFQARCNCGVQRVFSWASSTHLNCGDWTRVEIDRESAEAIVTALGGKVEWPDPDKEAFDEAREAFADLLMEWGHGSGARGVREGALDSEDDAAIRWLMERDARIREEARNG